MLSQCVDGLHKAGCEVLNLKRLLASVYQRVYRAVWLINGRSNETKKKETQKAQMQRQCKLPQLYEVTL